MNEASQHLTGLQERTIGFLDLPAELRNRVYDYAVESEPLMEDYPPLLAHRPMTQNTWPIKHQALATRKCFGLTQVCKQIRTEYLPLWKCNLWQGIAYCDFESFVDTFYANEEDTQAPKMLQIACDGRGLSFFQPCIDLLQFMRFRSRFPATKIKFVDRATVEWNKSERGPDYRMGQCFRCQEEDNGITTTLCKHRKEAINIIQRSDFWIHDYIFEASNILSHMNAIWIADIKSGFIVEVIIEEADGESILQLGLSMDGRSCCMPSRSLTLHEGDKKYKDGHREHDDWLHYRRELGLDADRFHDLVVRPYFV
ncbi:hypothetical protein SLS60_001409 [Paraconiothyrium brasiliense]|uniref:F-box domain-containing protein n=1 Tax=Paraconiothyrium brasiliense TaxID=300254 RepID=A0ABR3S996_9PLEO